MSATQAELQVLQVLARCKTTDAWGYEQGSLEWIHSWREPINMHAGYHDSLGAGLVGFGLSDSDLLARTYEIRVEPNCLQKLE